MENKSEQLFNSLIKRGRVSFRDYDIAEFNQIGNTFVAINYEGKVIGQFSFRQMVSKESGLWQFCEENKMLIGFSPRRWTKNAEECYGLVRGDIEYWGSDYEYRIIASALRDESELGDFLLSNIVIKDEKNVIKD